MLFLIRNLRATRVNLLMNDYAAGLPSPLAFLGLGDAVARHLDLPPWSARTLPVLHRVEPSRGRTKPEMEPKKPRKKGAPVQFMPIETMEDFIGDVEVSLLLDLPDCHDDRAVGKAIESRRIAGGTLQNDSVQAIAVTPDGTAFREISRGYAMIPPEAEDYRVVSTGEQRSLSRIAALLFPERYPPGSGWIVPVAVGHRLLEDPESAPRRIRLRDPNVPHVFTEPALGIAELVSVRNDRLTRLAEKELHSILWAWKAQGDYVLAHPVYQTRSRDKRKVCSP